MGVVIKRKADPVQSTAPDLTERQKNALIDAGLMQPDPPPPPKYKFVSLNKGGPVVDSTRYKLGDPAVIINDLYTWVKAWKAGDTGVVTRIFPPMRHDGAVTGDGGILEISFDNPRQEGHTKSLFRAWEVAPLTQDE